MKPGHVTLATKAVIYTVTGPNGATLEMRQEGDEWNGMVCMKGTLTKRDSPQILHGELILARTGKGFGTLLSESIANIWGKEPAEWQVMKASPLLIDHLGLLGAMAEPKPSAGEA